MDETYEPPETIPEENLEHFGVEDRSSIHWWSPDGTIQHLFIEGIIPREADRREIIRRVARRCTLAELVQTPESGPGHWVGPAERVLLDPDQIVLYVKMTGFEQHPGPEALEEMKMVLAEDLGWT